MLAVIPIVAVPWIIAGLCALFGIGGVAFAGVKQDKLEKEEKLFRAKIESLKEKYEELKTRAGEGDHQVRTLAATIARLKAELEESRRGFDS